ncbi:MAG TPA: hypothetical protein VFG22_16935 [Polyangiales bacterium]|nr:hypothetical protein [Polyangiales bacterium]
MARNQTRIVVGDLGDSINRVMRRLQLRLYQSLSTPTPVDTGFARGGWTPSTGAPDRSGPADQPSDRSAAIQLAKALFAQRSQESQRLAAAYMRESGPIYVVNNVRYVIYLDQGSSAQAPAHFVEKGIRLAIDATAREVSK